MIRIFTLIAVLFAGCFANLPVRADETCATCNVNVSVAGQFEHHRDLVTADGWNASWHWGNGFEEEIFGTNFTVTVSGLPAGNYTVLFGLVELEFTNAGARVFDIRYGDQLLASNLDIFTAAGSAGKVMSVRKTIEHADDSPMQFHFAAQTGAAKFDLLEIRNTDKQTLVLARAGDLLGASDAGLMSSPTVSSPVTWKDPSQPIDARVADLISRMSLPEKVLQMRDAAPAIPRLGIPAYNYWSECLHGVARSGVATVFPQAIGMAATWDTQLIHEEAHAIADEARAKNNAYRQAHNDDSAQYYGLHFWTPNINIFRDPRWGRGQETYGEDPYLTGSLGVSFIQGLQGNDPKYIEAMACAKHFAVHSGPESLRHVFDVEPNQRDLHETYLPQFEMAVRQGHVGGFMGAYNSVDGKPACANPWLLTELLRNQWGFDGYVTSDCGAIFDIWANHKFVSTPEAAAAAAVKAGDDLCCGTDYDSLVRAVREGLITSSEIDKALAALLKTRFRLGLFDPPAQVPYTQIPMTENDSPAHRLLALQVANESMVLLKNNGILPLNRANVKRILVIGANADSEPVLLGNYNGTPSRAITVLEGIRMVAGTNIAVDYLPGCPLASQAGENLASVMNFADDAAAARKADAVVYVGGISPQLEGEEMRVDFEGFKGGDRTRIELPAVQEDLLHALQGAGKPVIFVDCSGSAIAMPWEADHLAAILQAWYPGERGGFAVAQTLFGNNNPAGRLPVTFYGSTTDLPGFEDYSMANRTYRYFNGKPLFAFGHGLSYTTFAYHGAKLAANTVGAGDALKLTFTLKNTGQRDGDEVAQVYFRHENSAVPQPHEALCAFQRVHLRAGESKKVTLEIPARQLRYWDVASKQYVVEPGKYELLLGAASDDVRQKVEFKVAAR